MDALAPTHLVLVGIAALVLFFGWKQLPEMSRSLGRSLRLFKTELNSVGTDIAAPAVPEQPAPLAAPVAATSTEEKPRVA